MYNKTLELQKLFKNYNSDSASNAVRGKLSKKSEKVYVAKKESVQNLCENICTILVRNPFSRDKIDIQTNWKIPVSIDSKIFMSRYGILMTEQVKKKIQRIVGNRLRKQQHRNDKKVAKAAIYDMDQILSDLAKMLYLVLDGEQSYTFIMLKNHIHLNEIQAPVPESFMISITEAINELITSEMETDIMIDTLVKVSYMLATGHKSFKHLSFIENVDLKYDGKDIVRNLGLAISARIENGKTPTAGFTCFVESNPIIPVNNPDPVENIGICALMYLKFMCFKHENVTNMIDALIMG